MTAKSIIQIDVNDQAFKDFQRAFERFQDAAKKLPKINPIDPKASGALEKMAKLSGSIAQKLGVSTASAKKLTNEVEATAKQTQRMLHFAHQYGAAMASTAKTVAGITGNLLKWAALGGVLGGLAGLGGLFGFRALMQGGSDLQRRSYTTGMTAGQLRSGTNYMGQLLNFESLAQNLQTAKHSTGSAAAFAALGIKDPSKQNNFDLFKAVIPGIMEYMRGKNLGAGESEFYEPLFGGILPYSEYSAMKNAGPNAVKAAMARTVSSAPALEESQAQLARNARGAEALTAAGDRVETAFRTALNGLIDPITKLSSAVASAIQSFARSRELKSWIDSLGEGIKDFAKYLQSQSFKDDTEDFFRLMHKLGKGIAGTARFMGLVKSDEEIESGIMAKAKAIKEAQAKSGSFLPAMQEKIIESKRKEIAQELKELKTAKEREIASRLVKENVLPASFLPQKPNVVTINVNNSTGQNLDVSAYGVSAVMGGAR